jgi:hypothetical protein
MSCRCTYRTVINVMQLVFRNFSQIHITIIFDTPGTRYAINVVKIIGSANLYTSTYLLPRKIAEIGHYSEDHA